MTLQVLTLKIRERLVPPVGLAKIKYVISQIKTLNTLNQLVFFTATYMNNNDNNNDGKSDCHKIV